MPYGTQNPAGSQRGSAPDYRNNGRAPLRPARRIPAAAQKERAAQPNVKRPSAAPSRPTAARRPSERGQNRSAVSGTALANTARRPVQKVEARPSFNYEPDVHTIEEKVKKPFPTSLVFMTMLCTVLFMFVIISMVQINEYTVQISEMQGEMETLTDTAGELSSKIDKKNNMNDIEDYATGTLGMVKGDQLEKVHISTNSQDKIEVIEVEKDENGIIGSVLSAFAENFRGFLEYFG